MKEELTRTTLCWTLVRPVYSNHIALINNKITGQMARLGHFYGHIDAAEGCFAA